MTPATEQFDNAAALIHSATMARIQADIDNITYLPVALSRANSPEITQAIARLEMMTVTKEQFGPMAEQAVMARETTISALMALREGARKKERPDEVLRGDIKHVDAEKTRQQVQQQNAMRTIHAMQDMGHAKGSAGALRLIIESVAGTPVQAEEYGIGVDAVKLAQQAALDALRPKYEQAVILDGVNRLHDIADEMIEESADVSDDEILLVVAHHFGWSREKARNRLICIDFNNTNKDKP